MSTRIRHLYEFGPFCLNVTEKLFLRDEEIVPLTPKAFDTLLTLVQNNGQLVEKEELLREVWPDSFVAESSLTQNIHQIRKALGTDAQDHPYIETVPRRGYRFRAQVREICGDEPLPDSVRAWPPEHAAPFVVVPPATGLAQEGRPWLRRAGLVLAAGVLLLVGLSLSWYLRRGRTAAAVVPKSVAILPFQTMGLNANEELWGLGMADALIVKLSGQNKLPVLPTSAVIKYTNQDRDARAAGRELGVEAIVDGTIQRAGERVRVTLQILRVADGQHLWAGKFDEPFTDIFAVQDAVAGRVAEVLALQLTATGPGPQGKPYTSHTEAYQAYLTGRFFYEKRSREDLAKAAAYFQEAVRLDPEFALAHATLADCYYLQVYYGYEKKPVGETIQLVQKTAQQALALDPQLAEGYVALAGVKISFERNPDEAGELLKQALAFNPNLAIAHLRYGWVLFAQGKLPGALAQMRAAQELDPLSPTSNTALSGLLLMARQPDEAVKYARRAVELSPETPVARFALGDAYTLQGQYEAGLAEYQFVARRTRPDESQYVALTCSLAYTYAGAGKQTEARQHLARMYQLNHKQPLAPYQFGIVHAALGEADKAFEWLNKIPPEKRSNAAMLRQDPQLDPLRNDPRFAQLLEKYALP